MTDDPMVGWREELQVMEKIMEALEPLTMHQRMRVIEVIATVYRMDGLAQVARARRALLGPEPDDDQAPADGGTR